jgi:DNA mismatch endonuclease (patch repair protein)
LVDTISIKRRGENMRRIKSKGMKPEVAVRRLVHSMGYRFRLHWQKLPGKPDLVFVARKKILDVRGCFWHQHRRCVDSHIPKSNAAYWGPKLERNRSRDRKNAKQWRKLGWEYLTVWECEVSNIAVLSARLRDFLES